MKAFAVLDGYLLLSTSKFRVFFFFPILRNFSSPHHLPQSTKSILSSSRDNVGQTLCVSGTRFIRKNSKVVSKRM